MTATYAQRDLMQRRILEDEPDSPSVPLPLRFDDFYNDQYSKLIGLAIALTGNRMIAEDMVHDAFTEAHRRWDRVQGFEYPEAWIRRVLINKCRSRGRRLVSEAKMITTVRSRRLEPESEVRLPDRSSAVWEAVRKLPKRQAQAITLHYWEDLSVAEIATILELGDESIKTHLKRGRAKLNELMKGERDG